MRCKQATPRCSEEATEAARHIPLQAIPRQCLGASSSLRQGAQQAEAPLDLPLRPSLAGQTSLERLQAQVMIRIPRSAQRPPHHHIWAVPSRPLRPEVGEVASARRKRPENRIRPTRPRNRTRGRVQEKHRIGRRHGFRGLMVRSPSLDQSLDVRAIRTLRRVVQSHSSRLGPMGSRSRYSMGGAWQQASAKAGIRLAYQRKEAAAIQDGTRRGADQDQLGTAEEVYPSGLRGLHLRVRTCRRRQTKVISDCTCVEIDEMNRREFFPAFEAMSQSIASTLCPSWTCRLCE